MQTHAYVNTNRSILRVKPLLKWTGQTEFVTLSPSCYAQRPATLIKIVTFGFWLIYFFFLLFFKKWTLSFLRHFSYKYLLLMSSLFIISFLMPFFFIFLLCTHFLWASLNAQFVEKKQNLRAIFNKHWPDHAYVFYMI